MTSEHDRGRREGLRLAISILAAEQAKWEALVGESSSWRTNLTRDARHKTLKAARQRVQTALNRISPKDETTMSTEWASQLEKLGL